LRFAAGSGRKKGPTSDTESGVGPLLLPGGPGAGRYRDYMEHHSRSGGPISRFFSRRITKGRKEDKKRRTKRGLTQRRKGAKERKMMGKKMGEFGVRGTTTRAVPFAGRTEGPSGRQSPN
jgi:hypothetical protein